MSAYDPNREPQDPRPEEDLLERVLTQGGAESEQAAQWSQAVQRMRRSLRGIDRGQAAQAAALSRRILSQTTGEDLSWRGDLRLVGRYLRAGLRFSPVLRVAAASLLFHLAALPVLAYLVWSAGVEPLELSYESWDKAHPAQPFPDRPGDVAGQLPVGGVDEEPLILDQIPADPSGEEDPGKGGDNPPRAEGGGSKR